MLVASARLASTLLLAAALAGAMHIASAHSGTPTGSQAAPRDAAIRYVPDALRDASWLQKLRDDQLGAVAGVDVFHDFRFVDRVAESGISFTHHIVDDAGKSYKAAHYDHGNGIAMADVDGDGRLDIYFLSQAGGNQLVKNLGNGGRRNSEAPARRASGATRSFSKRVRASTVKSPMRSAPRAIVRGDRASAI